MSEGILADPEVSEGQSNGSPEQGSTPELGLGFTATPENSPADPEVAEGQSSEGLPTPEGEPVSPTDDNPSTDESEDTLLRADYSRKTMALADDRRAFEAEKAEWLTGREQAIDERQRADIPQNGATTADQFEQAASVAESADQRRGLMFMANQERTITELKDTVSGLVTRLEQVEPQVKEVTQATEELTQEQNDAITKRVGDQAKTAVTAFGKDSVSKARNFILRNLNTINDGTNEPYTVPELVAMHSGKPLATAQAAVEKQAEQRRAAKSKVAPTSPTHGQGNAGGYQTREAAVRDIASRS